MFIMFSFSRYTTVAYRAPEMIDLYAGHIISTKSDIWVGHGVSFQEIFFFIHSEFEIEVDIYTPLLFVLEIIAVHSSYKTIFAKIQNFHVSH